MERIRYYVPAVILILNVFHEFIQHVCLITFKIYAIESLNFILLGERELVEFLSDEIAAECKAQKMKNIPSKLDGFDVTLDGAEVTLTKKSGNETYVYYELKHIREQPQYKAG